VCLDDVLADLKLQPETLEVTVPHYFKEDNAVAIKLRDRVIAGYLKIKHNEETMPLEEDPELNPPSDDHTLEQVSGVAVVFGVRLHYRLVRDCFHLCIRTLSLRVVRCLR